MKIRVTHWDWVSSQKDDLGEQKLRNSWWNSTSWASRRLFKVVHPWKNIHSCWMHIMGTDSQVAKGVQHSTSTILWKGMQADVHHHCHILTSLVPQGRVLAKTSQPPLKPVEVGGPFHHVGVDVLELLQDYLTKRLEAFAVPNQTAETIAKLLVEEIFCTHGAHFLTVHKFL